MIMKKTIWIISLIGFIGFAQEKSELKTTFSGFIETYYSYDFDKPTSDFFAGKRYKKHR